MPSEYILDGHGTLLAFASNAAIKMRQTDTTPVGVDGGGANDTSTHHNTQFRTKAPKKLIELTDAQVVVFYNPEVYTDIMAMINVNQLITLTFPDGSTVAFWGWLDKFTPGNAVEGAPPTATVVVVASNQNAAQAETGPVVTPAP